MWAVGVILYEKITGSNPFAEKYEKQTSFSILNKTLYYKGLVWENISHLCKRFIKKLLIRDPKRRLTVEKALKDRWIHVLIYFKYLFIHFRWKV